MATGDLTPRESKVLEAAREYTAALAVLAKGKPPFTADDVFRIFNTREMVLNAVADLMWEGETGPSAPTDKSVAAPVLKPANG